MRSKACMRIRFLQFPDFVTTYYLLFELVSSGRTLLGDDSIVFTFGTVQTQEHFA